LFSLKKKRLTKEGVTGTPGISLATPLDLKCQASVIPQLNAVKNLKTLKATTSKSTGPIGAEVHFKNWEYFDCRQNF